MTEYINLFKSSPALLKAAFDAAEGRGFYDHSTADTNGTDQHLGAVIKTLRDPAYKQSECSIGLCVYGAGGWHRFFAGKDGDVIADPYFGIDPDLARAIGFKVRYDGQQGRSPLSLRIRRAAEAVWKMARVLGETPLVVHQSAHRDTIGEAYDFPTITLHNGWSEVVKKAARGCAAGEDREVAYAGDHADTGGKCHPALVEVLTHLDSLLREEEAAAERRQSKACAV